MADGSETGPLNPGARHNLRWFRIDGVLTQASESIVLAYLSLFVLALGANRGQIGLMSALASLSAAIVLLPGAIFVERKGRRKLTVLLSGGGGARVVLLLLALLPLFVSGGPAVSLAIALVVLRSAFVHLGVPAWTSLTADIVAPGVPRSVLLISQHPYGRRRNDHHVSSGSAHQPRR